MNRLLEFTTGENAKRVVVDALKILYVEDIEGNSGLPEKTCIIFADGRGSSVDVLEDAESVAGNWASVLKQFSAADAPSATRCSKCGKPLIVNSHGFWVHTTGSTTCGRND